MNFLCHALPYLDQPVRAACTGVPDWLSVIDRKIRARRKLATPYLNSTDPLMAELASGIVCHIEDDQWFHGSELFTRLNLEFAVQLRQYLPGDEGFRPSFVGHVVIEMLLDGHYVLHQRQLVDRYYAVVDSLPAEKIQSRLNRITGKPTDRFAATIRRFVDLQFIYDYATDKGVLFRINQVLARVRLAPLPDTVLDWIAEVRTIVEQNHQPLLTPTDGPAIHPPI